MRGLVLLALLLGGLPAAAEGVAPGVTEGNLLERERFWPYHVALVEPWQPPGRAQPLRAGTQGVLIRVESSGAARIDFGRNGRWTVPLGATDLLLNANRIRSGELHKSVPNFALAIGTKLLDSGSERLAPLGLARAAEQRGFLCVFADPGAEGFAELAAALAPLRERAGLMTVLFPQARGADAETRERLRALAWPVPFVYDALAPAYTRSLLPDGTPRPALLLQTSEGRVLFQGPWSAHALLELRVALDRAFGAASAAR
jgi:hypothetical protein